MRNKNVAIHEHHKKLSLFRNRCFAALGIVLFLVAIIIARLIFLQIKQHQFYSTLSQQNILNTVPSRPNRGLIYDRHGVILAKNVPAYNLAIIPESGKATKEKIAQLKKIIPISQNEINQFYHILNQYRPYQPVPIKFKLSEEEAATFYVNRYRFPGVIIQIRMTRYYPLGESTSAILGYVGRINAQELKMLNSKQYDIADDIGKMGLEKYYESLLHGKPGAEEAEIDASGRAIRVLKETAPRPGANIYLTIDNKLQQLAESTLGDESGAIVIIQPKTGAVLSLVSHPSYDPNSFITGLSTQEYQKLLNSPLHPLYNRAIRGQFAPGSTIKPFLAIAALDDGIISPAARIYDPGWFQLPNTAHLYRDYVRYGHGWTNIEKALIVSCDTFFYHLAEKQGNERMVKMLTAFGLGNLTHIDMPEELSGIIPTPDWKRGAKGQAWYSGDTIESGIGQGFMLATPLQLAQATAILANRGLNYPPTLLLKTVFPDGHVIQKKPNVQVAVKVKHPWVWDFVIQAMQKVIDDAQGTAHYYFGSHLGYTVAAKTGTAQLYHHQKNEESLDPNSPKQLRNNHLFIAFAPVDHPEIAIAIVVEHSAMADRMARKLFDYYFKNKNTII